MSWFSRRNGPRRADPAGSSPTPRSSAATPTTPTHAATGSAAAGAGGTIGTSGASGAGGGNKASGAGGQPEHRSLAFATLLGSLTGRQRYHLLDLGPAVGSNVEFLARYGCKLTIQDLYGALAPHLSLGPAPAPNPIAASLGSQITADRASAREARTSWEARQEREEQQRHEKASEPGDVAAQLGELLTFPPDTQFDAVLAWDLLNYLDRREVASLARYLAPLCRPGALVFAIVTILKQAPAEPLRFRIVDDEHLSYQSRTAAERPCPRYAPAELTELLRGFRLDRSYLMRHGVQEYLFARQDSP